MLEDDDDQDSSFVKIAFDTNSCESVYRKLQFYQAKKSTRGRTSKRNPKSQYTGVYYQDGKWQANLILPSTKDSPGSKTIYLGLFETEVEAARAYDSYCFTIVTKFLAVNFPQRFDCPLDPVQLRIKSVETDLDPETLIKTVIGKDINIHLASPDIESVQYTLDDDFFGEDTDFEPSEETLRKYEGRSLPEED